jgi:type IV pilus biogenesis protein CpaD/CtpE
MLLAGCVNESADLGQAQPVLLTTSRQIALAPLPQSRSGATVRRLRQQIYAISGGDLPAVRALIRARTGSEAEAIRRIVIGIGLDPSRVTKEPYASAARRMPEVILTHTQAAVAPCASAIQPAFMEDPLPSLMSLAQCNQTNNLAAMLVDPADLAEPLALDYQDGAYLVDGVHSWRANRTTALPVGAGTPSLLSDPGLSASAISTTAPNSTANAGTNGQTGTTQ